MSKVKATGSRRVAREAAYQALYMMEVGKESASFALKVVRSRQSFTEEADTFLRHLVIGVDEYQSQLDSLIEPRLAKGWSMRRIAVSDLVALRLATFELLHLAGMPPKVSITEAVELAKRYGTKSSGSFVNGVLGNILKETSKANWDPDLEERPLEDAPDAKLPVPEEEDEPNEEVVDVQEGSPEFEEMMKAGAWVIRNDE